MAAVNIDKVLAAANKVLLMPSTTLKDACSEFGISLSPIAGFIGGSILSGSPLLWGGAWLVGKYKKSQRERQEKDRMKNEIIRKQQAIINKLKQESELNKQEIKNLRDTLEMLEEVLSKMNAA